MNALSKAAFLDRDGTIIEDVGYLSSPRDVRLLPYAARGIRRLRELGYRIVVVTNQSGIARGYYTEQEFQQVQERLEAVLRGRGAAIDATYFCPHHPAGSVPPYNVECDCRKPKPGLLLRAAQEMQLDLAQSVMIGDAERDIQAGQQAGCRTMLIHSEPRSVLATPDFLTANLWEAAGILEAQAHPR